MVLYPQHSRAPSDGAHRLGSVDVALARLDGCKVRARESGREGNEVKTTSVALFDGIDVIDRLVLAKGITPQEWARTYYALLNVQPRPAPEVVERAERRLAETMTLRLRCRDALRMYEKRGENPETLNMVARELYESLKLLEKTL